jgi:hypothetical protein
VIETHSTPAWQSEKLMPVLALEGKDYMKGLSTVHERKNRRLWERLLGKKTPWEAIATAAASPPSTIVDWLLGKASIGIAKLPCLKKSDESDKVVIVHELSPSDALDESARLLPRHIVELVVKDEDEQKAIVEAQAKLETAVAFTFGLDALDSVVQNHPELVLTPHVLTRLLKLAQHYHLGTPLILQGKRLTVK